jgi:hypothetical protein
MRAVHQRNRDNLGIMNAMTLLKDMKAQIIGTNYTIQELNNNFSNPIFTRKDANNDIEHQPIGSLEFSSSHENPKGDQCCW